MPRPISASALIGVLALGIGLMSAVAGALAQVSRPRDAPPPGAGDTPEAASPSGARYIPGVGFRFVTPPGPRVYGYRAAPRVYGYYADRESMRHRRYYRHAACDSDRAWWGGERCSRRWR